MSGSPLASPENARRTLDTMWTIRRFEEAVDDLFARGLMHGTMHLSIGEEASAVGACLALRERRLHHLAPTAVTATASPRAPTWSRMMAELLGKETGYCRGRGGSMHIADVATRHPGRERHRRRGGIPIAAGAALAVQLRGEDRVVGLLLRRRRHQPGHLPRGPQPGRDLEAAGRLRLREQPVRHVLRHREVDGGRAHRRARGRRTASRASRSTATTSSPCTTRVQAAVDRARAGEGPTLVEAVTYRWKGHSKCDKNRYRTKDEIAEWRARRPDPRLRAQGGRRRAAHRGRRSPRSAPP